MLKNKVAMVTGGSRGIGRAIVERFHQQSARVITCDPDCFNCIGRKFSNPLPGRPPIPLAACLPARNTVFPRYWQIPDPYIHFDHYRR